MTPLTTEHNPANNVMFRKNYTTIAGRLLPVNPFLDDSFIRVVSGIAYSEKLRAFVNFIPEVNQQKCKEFFDRRLFRCPKNVSDTIARNNCVVPAT